MLHSAKSKLLNAIFSLFAISFQILQPFLLVFSVATIPTPAYAQEVVDVPSPEPSLTPTPNVSPTPEPTNAAEPTPTPSIAPSITPSPSPSEQPETDNPSIAAAVESSEPTPTNTPEFDFSSTEVASATIITNKPDYSPRETVIITASDLLPLTTYELEISSSDPPATTFTDSTTTTETGNITYSYQLDDIYRPNYTVNLFLYSVLVLSTTFTDSPGAVWTTDSSCNTVNGNIYSNKNSVHLNGGPIGGGPGLADGNYYVKVTEPNGTLLGSSVTANATVVGGKFIQCYNLMSIAPFADTGNAGGEYKVWVSQDGSFPNSASKTDNFKVLSQLPTTPPIYSGPDTCSDGLVKGAEVYSGSISSTSATGTEFLLTAGQEYLFEVGGTYSYDTSSQSKFADSAYATSDNWASTREDIGIWGTNQGVTSLLGDLGLGVGIILWDQDTTYNTSHNYSFAYTPTINNAHFLLSDWYADWYSSNPSCNNQGCLQDNTGELTLNVFQCEEPPLATISGYKWHDLNQDSQRQDEPGLAGWDIIIRPLDLPAYETFTVDSSNPSGHDSSPLAAGHTYLVEADGIWYNFADQHRAVDADYYSDNIWSNVDDLDNDSTRDPRQLDLVIDNSDVDWASYNSSHLYKTVLVGDDTYHNFRIYDQDGVGNTSWYQDNTGSLTIRLYDVTDYLSSTDANGFYSAQVKPGSYQVVEVQQTGWSQTYPSNPSYYHLTVGPNQQQSADFGNYYPQGLIQGTKYYDENTNGVHDYKQGVFTPYEGQLLNGWTIRLYDSGWTLVDETLTQNLGNQGQYRFSAPPGDYYVCEVEQDGWYQTGPLLGAGTVDNSHNPTGNGTAVANSSGKNDEAPVCWSVSLEHNERDGWLKFGNVEAGNIVIRKETNPKEVSNDIQFTFSLDWDDELVLGSGAYATYENLLPGTYSINEQKLAGWQLTSETCDNGSSPSSIKLAPGETVTCTFTNTQLSSISGTKLEDQDGTVGGVTSAVPNWTIELWLDEAYYSETTTDNSGDYSFVDLLPGNYMVKEVIQAGWTNLIDTNTNLPLPLSAGQDSTDNDFTNVRYGSIQGRKYNDVNGNGDFDQAEKSAVGNPNRLDDWLITLYTPDFKYVDSMFTGDSSTLAGSVGKGQYRFVNLYPGNYYVCETMQAGWTQTEPDSGYLYNGNYCHSVTVKSGEAVTGIQFGNVQLSSLHGYKWNDLDQDGEVDSKESKLAGWTINLYEGRSLTPTASMTTSSDPAHYGWYWFENLLPGNYRICEEMQSGWTQTYPAGSCYNITLPDDNSLSFPVSENAVVGPEYNFGNTNLGDLLVTKYNDVNGNGKWDRDEEESLSGWTMNVDNGDTYSSSLDTGVDGTALFSALPSGDYLLSEESQAGWTQTNISCGNEEGEESIQVAAKVFDLSDSISVRSSNLTIYPGETTHCYLGNQEDPVLTIKKSNDATGSKGVGDLVTFTLEVSLSGSQLHNVKVVDVPAKGFVYQAGSSTGTTDEPSYGSPGTWDLGEMSPGDTITLTYQAKIEDGTDPGDYKDLAYAYGCRSLEDEVCTPSSSSSVLADAVDSPYISGNFVGTLVTIGQDQTETGSVNIESEGEVLGASTSLPATGGNTNWLYLALVSLFTGLALLLGKKYLTRTILVISLVVLSLVSAPSASAASLSVRLESPKSPTRDNDWDLSFSTLDLLSRTPTTKCYLKKPGESSYQEFDNPQVASKPEGDNGSCHLDSSLVNDQGDYELYVVTSVTGPNESVTSEHVIVTYDSEGPGQPVSYSKDHPWACRYVINFKTAADSGATSWVEIYSSSSRSFDTNSSTRVGSVSIGSDQEGEFIHDRANDCQDDYYYVIRAFDSAGNQSAHLGDQVVITSTTSQQIDLAPAQPANSTDEVSLGQTPDDQTGSVLGQEDEASDSPEMVELNQGELAGADDFLNQIVARKYWWLIPLSLAIITTLYVTLRRRQK